MNTDAELDYLGPQGGLMALAFAAGCVACFSFCALVGRFIWAAIGRVKDDEIALIKAEADADRDRCAAMEVRLVQRIQQLEGIILTIAPGSMRQQIQAAISEMRVEERQPPQ